MVEHKAKSVCSMRLKIGTHVVQGLLHIIITIYTWVGKGFRLKSDLNEKHTLQMFDF